jgi:hypothetical protein
MWRSGHLQCYHLPTNSHENPPIGSKVTGGQTRQTHRQASELTRLLSFLNESRLKIQLLETTGSGKYLDPRRKK